MEAEHTESVLNEKLPLQQLQTLDPLIEVLIAPRRLKRDLFFALLLILMRENDFIQIKARNEGTIDVKDFILNARKKNSDIYDATFILKHFRDLPVKILATPLSNVLVLNAVIMDTDKTYSMCVEIDNFVLSSRLRIPHAFFNLEELSATVRNFVTPIRSYIFNSHHSKHETLLSLPEAILLRIFLNLRVRDVLNLSESCRRMNCIVKKDLVWSLLYNRDFSDAHKYDGRGWLDMYRGIYVLNRRHANNVQAFGENADCVRHAEHPKWEVIL